MKLDTARPSLAAQPEAGLADPVLIPPIAVPGLATGIEWPTIGLLVGAHALFALLVVVSPVAGPLAWLALVPVITLHSSLQHELLHGHPFRNPRLNALLVALPLGLFIPYWRFRALHIAHHDDPRLTDPYEDPESWYLHPRDWASAGRLRRGLLEANNTLAGRVVLGPLIGLTGFLAAEARLALCGRRDVLRAWGWHLAGAGILVGLLRQVPGFSFGGYLAACYGAYALLCVRTFLEHRAEEEVGHRTVLIEDRGPLAFLFLFNSLHAVHHRFPRLPWYRLPGVYERHREAFVAGNGGYVYRSYLEIARRHAFTVKEPVPHPLAGRDSSRGS
ncbi:fatty acid desaturase [Stappia sp.]|uniref:fatty acid desaturase n=1 Tax=Stappia sp. TaxID=1870903 RepID=UPI003A99B37E